MPLGLVAIVAVGVHAAADAVDDRLLVWVERFNVAFEAFMAEHESTRHWVGFLTSRRQTEIARGIALGWELLVDLSLALPMFGYFEQTLQERMQSKETWKTLWQRTNFKPTPMRLLRPVLTAIFAAAGAFAVSRMVESALFFSLQSGALPDAFASPAARALGAAAFLLTAIAFGGRATLRAWQHADRVCLERESAGPVAVFGAPQKKKTHSPWTAGLIGTALALPLAVAALFDALPLLSFFR